MSGKKQRLDTLLVEMGLVESRSRGQALIMAGSVLVNGRSETKSGTMVPIEARIELTSPPPYVGRGGYKLAAAIDAFEIDVSGRICADVGAGTGGFTDVLLQRGALHVIAIDVGYAQFDWRLRQDERVTLLERTNARYLGSLPKSVSLVSIDVSFISLRKILPSAKGWLGEEGDIIALIKPQFEAGREQVGKGGIVRDPAVHQRVLHDVLSWCHDNGLLAKDLIRSPIKGSAGNVEFLVWLQPGKKDVLNREILSAIESVSWNSQ
jgi:23S rRNA (cytidine1920-2'-O)/16S rRNA (cytidine1409-2'-O)-methyltransferase